MHRLRLLVAKLMLKNRTPTPVEDNHAKVALRLLAEDAGTSVKSFRKRKQYREAYNVWKECYGQ